MKSVRLMECEQSMVHRFMEKIRLSPGVKARKSDGQHFATSFKNIDSSKSNLLRRHRIFCRRRIEDDVAVVEKLHKNRRS